MEEAIITIYKEILNGKRKRFPLNFWKQKNKNDCKIVFYYLFNNVLELTIEDIVEKLDYNMISKFKLTTPFNKFCNGKFGDLLRLVYPELNIRQRRPMRKCTRKKISIVQKNLSPEKHNNIVKGMRENRYTKVYAKKLSDTKLGEINPKHKLKTNQVREIKKMWLTGNYSTARLGEQFGVKRQTIADIVYGRTWKHIK